MPSPVPSPGALKPSAEPQQLVVECTATTLDAGDTPPPAAEPAIADSAPAPTADQTAAVAPAAAAAAAPSGAQKAGADGADGFGISNDDDAGDELADLEMRTRAMLRGVSAVDLSRLLAPVVICGPSGVGKGTIIAELMRLHPAKFAFCVSHTTRGPRPGEVNGQHYHFVTLDAMRGAVDKGAFLEHAHVHGNMYGTSLAAVGAVSDKGRVAILDIDVQGAEQVRRGLGLLAGRGFGGPGG